MDSRSHVEFALRLLPKSYETAALTSLFPQIDRRPATLHRNYAHHLPKVRSLVRVGWASLIGDSELAAKSWFPTKEEESYVASRFRDETERIRSYLDVKMPQTIGSDFVSAAEMAYVSHLYLDTFNQPVQAFTPSRSVVSGQFELWDRVGDFRYRLYVQGVVEELRKDWLKSSIWNTTFTVSEMTHAMITRLAQLAGQEERAFLDSALERAGFIELQDVSSNAAVAWLKDMEHELTVLHMRYLG